MVCKKLFLFALLLVSMGVTVYAQGTPVEGDFIARDFKFESGETLPELGLAEREIKRVKRGRFILLPITDQTRGHGTHTLPAIWKEHLAALLKESERPKLDYLILETAEDPFPNGLTNSVYGTLKRVEDRN